MGRAGIDLEMAHDPPSQRAAREHPLHRLEDDTLRMPAVEDRAFAAAFDAAGIARVPIEDTVAALVAGELHFLGIDDDHVVAAIHVWGIGGLVLAAKTQGYDRGDPAEHQAVRVDQQPLLVDLVGFEGKGRHRILSKATQYDARIWPVK